MSEEGQPGWIKISKCPTTLTEKALQAALSPISSVIQLGFRSGRGYQHARVESAEDVIAAALKGQIKFDGTIAAVNGLQRLPDYLKTSSDRWSVMSDSSAKSDSREPKPSPRPAYRQCKIIHGHSHIPESPAMTFQQLADWCAVPENAADQDIYGQGSLIQKFESQIATLLGFESAGFMPSGTMAQLIALRIHCVHQSMPYIGLHPTSHLELHEQRAYSVLHQMQATPVGDKSRPIEADDVKVVSGKLAALCLELPVREIGGQLPTWEQLEAVKQVCAERGIKLHIDGARLWECAAYYQRSYAAICAGTTSCYVSFYKGIGAMTGAMLLGSKSFTAEARVWQRRHGGNLFTMLPYVASAAMNFNTRLARMPQYLTRARAIAKAIHSVRGCIVLPEVPHVNMMHVFLRASASGAVTTRDAVANELKFWLFTKTRATDVPGYCVIEIYVGDAALNVTDDEIIAAFSRFVQLVP
eukprot:TRINITY_DN1339_c0_g1_i1.p1 TRINITY_DN1339_c0_g1~~TRINITY_DN1339_c0_g1_i1.p1  ORF type:complete len:493 (+),score=101.63 TRINITY_DN1339_c0_g1_i1:67-1479(+)